MIQVTCIEKENRKALASQCHPSERAGPTCGSYIASQLRKANFHDDIDDHLKHIVTKLLVEPGNLFRGYNPDKHGPLDRRFGASVRNEIAKLIQKAQNRRKYVPTVPLASHDRVVQQEPHQALIRSEIMEKYGKLGVRCSIAFERAYVHLFWWGGKSWGLLRCTG